MHPLNTSFLSAIINIFVINRIMFKLISMDFSPSRCCWQSVFNIKLKKEKKNVCKKIKKLFRTILLMLLAA